MINSPELGIQHMRGLCEELLYLEILLVRNSKQITLMSKAKTWLSEDVRKIILPSIEKVLLSEFLSPVGEKKNCYNLAMQTVYKTHATFSCPWSQKRWTLSCPNQASGEITSA